MKLEFKNTPKQIELIKAMASKDALKATEARQIFANLVGPTIGQVLNSVDTTRMFYKDFTFAEDDDPSMPVEPLLNVGQNYLSVWSQTTAGGLPSNQVYQVIDEVKFSTYRLDSAMSWDKRYNKKARLDVIAMFLERLVEEITLKTNRKAWIPVLTVLATASNGGVSNVKRAITAGRLTLQDVNKLFSRIRRQNMSWASGSTSTVVGKLTDMVMSVEILEQIREFAFNPINTSAALGITPVTDKAEAGAVVTLPENQRAAILAGGDVQSIFGVRLHELAELGIGQKYNTYFDDVAGSTAYTTPAGAGSAMFTGSSEELVIGLDLTRPFAYRAIQTDGDTGSTFSMSNDDQWVTRSDKLGVYGSLREGRVVTQSRPIHGLIV